MRVLLAISILVFLGFGVVLFAMPEVLEIIGLVASGPEARIELRATYGGMELGFALFLFLCFRREDWLRVGLCASGCVVAGFGVARILAILIEGAGTPIMWALVGIELVSALIIFYALRRTRTDSATVEA